MDGQKSKGGSKQIMKEDESDTATETQEINDKKKEHRSPKGCRKQSLEQETSVKNEAIPPKRPKVDAEGKISLDSVVLSGEVQHSPVPGPSSSSTKSLARSPIKLSRVNEGDDDKLKGNSGNSFCVSDTVYQIKWLEHGGRCTPIITQNENGPCPLLSIANVLYLRNKLTLAEGTLEISEEKLLNQVHQAIMDTLPKDGHEQNPNVLQNVQDALTLLPQLRTGLNVNVRFSGVKNFEYTPECVIFDVLSIPLYHGWILDPQSTEIMAAIGNRTYNQLVENIIEKKTSKDPDKVAEALTAETFLEATASQLTVHGLCELNASLKKGELAVLFRNNHFIVLYKHERQLCQLVTDQGFLDENDVVWETLSTINGDETFLNASFQSSISKGSPSLNTSEEQQISQDFLVALSLQDEQNKQQDKEFGWDAYGNALGAIGMTSDEELARQLHVEEQRMAQVSASRAGTPTGEKKQSSPSSTQSRQSHTAKEQEESKTRDWKCCIS